MRIIDYKGENPIDVVIPHKKDREWFFENTCLPSIVSNNPNKIIIVDEDDHPCAKRNRGFDEVDSKFVFFCDDDIMLYENCFDEMLKSIGHYGFAYCNYLGMSVNGHPKGSVFEHRAKKFDVETLKSGNYISTMSLLRRDCAPRFDETLERYQDWDLFLTLVKQGNRGVFIDKVLFTAFYFGESITNVEQIKELESVVRKKHGI